MRILKERPRQAPIRYRFDEAARARHKWRNWLHSILLLSGMGLLVTICAFGLFGLWGAIVMALGGALAITAAPRIAPEWVIRAYRGTPLTERNFPQGLALLRELAERAELNHLPSLYYIPSRMLNAFATGHRDRSAIAITDGMLRSLSARELAGVLAHEISHVKNDDLWLMGVADIIGRIASFLSYFGIFLLLTSLFAGLMGKGGGPYWVALLLIAAPTICSLLQLALSRAREFDADLEAATITGDPAGLASALAKLERIQGRHWEDIILPGRKMPDPSLLRTHPPTADRIERLKSLLVAEPALVWPADPVLPPMQAFSEPRAPRFVWPGFWC